MNNIINISDIELTTCYDGIERHLLDSADKIIRWIEFGFSLQREKAESHDWLLDLEIDLSRCVLTTGTNGAIHNFSLLDVIRKAKEIESQYLDCDGYDHNSSRRFVNLPFVCNNSIFYYGGFQKTTFNKKVTFESTVFINAAFFSDCHFKHYLSFNEAKFLYSCSFIGSTFSYTYFDKAEFNVASTIFSGSKFKEGVSFTDIIFSQISSNKTRQIIGFTNCVFEKNSVFKNTIFTEETHFDGSIFNGVCLFDSCSYNYTVCFKYIEVFKQLILRNNAVNTNDYGITFGGATIIGSLDIININTIGLNGYHIFIDSSGLFRIFRCKIEKLELNFMVSKGILLLQNNKPSITSIDLQEAANLGIIEIEDTQIQCKNRITARLLKDSANKSNNVIDSTHYKSEEYRLYRKELLLELKKVFEKGSLKRVFSFPITDLGLLLLNTISNNNGKSWFRSVIFTCVTAWIFFIGINYLGISKGSFFDWGWHDWVSFEKVWKEYLNMFYLVEFKDKFDQGIELNALGETMFFISKIFVGYGVYQTISAFRKYGK